jgi:drug/metabolite transporter (DMT)-like permease
VPLAIALWTLVYSVVVAASILLLGNPSTVLGHLTPKTLLLLLLDWRFLLGGVLALGARFIFVIINNLASKDPNLSHAHLSITAVATTVSIIVVLLANYFLLGEQLRAIQLVGAAVMMAGFFLVFR